MAGHEFAPAALTFWRELPPLGPTDSTGSTGVRQLLATRWRADRSGSIRASVDSDTSGGHLQVSEVRVLAGSKPNAKVLQRRDGSRPVTIVKGQWLEVVVEYSEPPGPSSEPSFTGTLVVASTATGTAKTGAKTSPKASFRAEIPLRAHHRRRVLLVIDGDPAGGLHASFAPGIVPGDTGAQGNGSWFNVAYLVATMRRELVPAGYAIVRAHRQLDPSFPQSVRALPERDRVWYTPDFQNFRFDALDLADFDQIWLFGIGSPAKTAPLADSELVALARFMNAGGGVFATGDHEDLGAPMCSRVLRVRSMRKWWFALEGPDNEPKAPDAFSPLRRDTTRPGRDETLLSPDFRFDNQSDDIPQPIVLTPAGTGHLVTTLPDGRPLGVLPDHMHEGEVIDPFDGTFTFSPTISYGGVVFDEYPTSADGQPRPQILALSEVPPGHTTMSTEPNHESARQPTASPSRMFGAIGVYDGRLADVGRVVVSSTFHHFVDINLIGDPWAVGPDGQIDVGRRKGFLASERGRSYLGDIEAYFVAIVRWLSRP